jgi:hypothetical protein
MASTAILKATDGREYAADLLDREEYREKLKKRLDSGDISPQLEVHLHKLRFGNPQNAAPEERVNSFSGMSDEELANRVMVLQQMAVQLIGPITINVNQSAPKETAQLIPSMGSKVE